MGLVLARMPHRYNKVNIQWLIAERLRNELNTKLSKKVTKKKLTVEAITGVLEVAENDKKKAYQLRNFVVRITLYQSIIKSLNS